MVPDTAWAVPVAIDVAILVFSAADLLLSYWRMAKPSMRLIPWAFTAATIWLNWQAGGPVPIRVAHAAMPALWVLFCEYARHVLAARVGLVNGGRMEKVRRSRWLLAPLSTARLRRQMILWEITSYRRALELEAERRAKIARLEMAHGRKWRRQASADERLAIKLSKVAPAELLPTLTATITPGEQPEPAVRPGPAVQAKPETAHAPVAVTPPEPEPSSPTATRTADRGAEDRADPRPAPGYVHPNGGQRPPARGGSPGHRAGHPGHRTGPSPGRDDGLRPSPALGTPQRRQRLPLSRISFPAVPAWSAIRPERDRLPWPDRR